VLGIRPTDLGFRRVEIVPLLGPSTAVAGSLVHPRGRIDVNLSVVEGTLNGTISLPEGVTGTLRYGELTQELVSGTQPIATISPAQAH
jgi:alpha-L-rhamnosidase